MTNKVSRMLVRLISCLILAIAPICGWAGPVIWIDDSSNNLHTVDLETRTSLLVGNISSPDTITDIAMSPAGELWGMSFGSIYRIDKTNAVATLVGQHGIPSGNALTFDSEGRLFAAGGSSTRLYFINQATGVATALPGNMGAGSAGDIVFARDSLYLADTSGRLIRLLLSGAFPYNVTPVTVGSFGNFSVFGLALASDSTGRLFATAGSDVFLVNVTTAALTPFSVLPSGLRANGATSETAASIVVVDPPEITASELAIYAGVQPSTDPMLNTLLACTSVGSGTGRRNLVLISHGWRSDPSAWATPLQQAIVSGLRAQANLGAWDVCAIDWSELAGTALPAGALSNASLAAAAVWPSIRNRYRFAHLIGHSAGSAVIQTLGKCLKDSGLECFPNNDASLSAAVVHTTFLDAYDAGKGAEYGCGSDWSDSYVDMRAPVLYPVLANTNLLLGCAVNVDVTRVDPVFDALGTPLPPLSPVELAIRTLNEEVRVHAWPYHMYSYMAGVQHATTVGLDPLDAWPIGFALAKESGRTGISNPNQWVPIPERPAGDPFGLPTYSIAGLEQGSRICLSPAFDGRSRTVDCVSNLPLAITPGGPVDNRQASAVFVVRPQPEWLGANAQTTTSITGIVSHSLPNPDFARLTNRSPAWVTYAARLSERTDTVRFAFTFTPGGASNGLLSVYVDNQPVYRISQAVAGATRNSSGLIRVGTLEPGFHSIAFRLDMLNNTPSEITLSNLEVGRVEIQRTANTAPLAAIAAPVQARVGSRIALDGANSRDPDSTSQKLAYLWSQLSGPGIVFDDPSLLGTSFTPDTPGTYRIQLIVRDRMLPSQPVSVSVLVPVLGDVDFDGDVDSNDLSAIRAAISSSTVGVNDILDLNGDLTIGATDVDLARSRCTASCSDAVTKPSGGGGAVGLSELLGFLMLLIAQWRARAATPFHHSAIS